MKLALFTHYMPPHEGGIERIAEDHATAAAAAGWDVRWVASAAPRGRPQTEQLGWGTARRVPCLDLAQRALGVPYPVWLGARRVVDEVVAWADVVHVHDVLYPGTSMALRAAAASGRPSLLTQHVGPIPYPTRLLRGVQQVAYATIGARNARRATRWGFYNDAVLQSLRDVAKVERPVVFLPNGVDSALFRPVADAAEKDALRRRFGLPAAVPVILFVGRLVFKKGAPLLAAAAPQRAHTLLVGERGPVDFEVRPGIEVRPFMARDQLAELMRACDVLALPSRGEGFPLVAQEAMSSGLPVALGPDPGYASQLDAETALLWPLNVGAWREGLQDLVDRPARRAELGARARHHAVRRWDLASCRQRLLHTYEQLLGGQASKASA